MDKLVKIWNIMDEETEGEKGRKRDISLATSRDLGLVSLPQSRSLWSCPALDPSLPLSPFSITLSREH
jgi:periodic tryptophan protein 1